MRVSAIMITGKTLSRQPFARVAVRCFLEQTYADRELVIVNDGEVALGFSDPRVREVLLPRSRATTLGDLRNIGLREARGDLVIQWDDDDWHHPERMETQVWAWEKGVAVLLRQQIRYNTLDRASFLSQWPGGIHGTILHEKREDLKYPSLRLREDTVFLEGFERRNVVDTSPPLYVRFYHGSNSWSARHIMGQPGSPVTPGESTLSAEDQEFLDWVLSEYYPELLDQNPR